MRKIGLIPALTIVVFWKCFVMNVVKSEKYSESMQNDSINEKNEVFIKEVSKEYVGDEDLNDCNNSFIQKKNTRESDANDDKTQTLPTFSLQKRKRWRTPRFQLPKVRLPTFLSRKNKSSKPVQKGLST